MNDTALRSRQILRHDMLEVPEPDLLPLRWSVPIWLILAAASWAGVFYVVSLIV